MGLALRQLDSRLRGARSRASETCRLLCPVVCGRPQWPEHSTHSQLSWWAAVRYQAKSK